MWPKKFSIRTFRTVEEVLQCSSMFFMKIVFKLSLVSSMKRAVVGTKGGGCRYMLLNVKASARPDPVFWVPWRPRGGNCFTAWVPSSLLHSVPGIAVLSQLVLQDNDIHCASLCNLVSCALFYFLFLFFFGLLRVKHPWNRRVERCGSHGISWAPWIAAAARTVSSVSTILSASFGNLILLWSFFSVPKMIAYWILIVSLVISCDFVSATWSLKLSWAFGFAWGHEAHWLQPWCCLRGTGAT